MTTKDVTMTFDDVARKAGFRPGPDGKFSLPSGQETADALAAAAAKLIGEWMPGDQRSRVTLTGAGPVWGHLAIAHALHGRAIKLTYAAPNATVTVWDHGDSA